MLRLLLFSVLAIALLFSAASCTKKVTMANGQKQVRYTKFNFRFNNQNITRASIYKRYVATNRNFKEYPGNNKRNRRTPNANKRYIALNKN